MDYDIPRIPLGRGIEYLIDVLASNFSGVTYAISGFIGATVKLIAGTLLYLPAPLMIVLITAICWGLTRKLRIGAFTLFGLAFIWNIGLWEPTMETIALVAVATIVSIAIGIPLGIAAAIYSKVSLVVMPVLDFMQTLPAFVYLIPAIPFFGLGATSAIFSTVIFAMPPAIRLTALGIRQVPEELVEAAEAFGSTKMQKLIKVQLPLAAPTIRAGVNQTILLSLSMVVIAAMIGAGGLGAEVWKAIQRLNAGMGFEAGIGIVIVAIILDRVIQNIKTRDYKTPEVAN
jgi:glycine betaine/proline transport system permease protein